LGPKERKKEGKKERRNKKENYSKIDDNLCHLSAGTNGQDTVNLLEIPVKTKTKIDVDVKKSTQ
jgi:hypothetical protein